MAKTRIGVAACQNPCPLFVSNQAKSGKHPKHIGVDLGGTNIRAGLVQNGKKPYIASASGFFTSQTRNRH
jgi:hexokinase